jgi:4-amino-4-deoxy-L-arabinose transferase-like glycosyltransferase
MGRDAAYLWRAARDVRQDLGAFATYDAMAIFCLASAFWLGIRGAHARNPSATVVLYFGCAGMLAMGDAVKYASALWNPVVVIVVAAVAWRLRGRRMEAVATAGALIAVLGVVLALAVKVGGPAYWHGIQFTTLSRSVYNNGTESRTSVFWLGFTYGWVVIVLAVAAFIFKVRAGWPSVLMFGALAAGTLAAPLNQARIDTYTSLYKHVAFGAWFGAIAAGGDAEDPSPEGMESARRDTRRRGDRRVRAGNHPI